MIGLNPANKGMLILNNQKWRISMRLLVNIVITSVLFVSAAFSQSVQGNYELNYVTVHYIYEVREIESAQDSLEASYAVTASWPS